MAFDVSIKSGDQAASSPVSLLALLIGCCALGVVGGVGGHSYTFYPGDDAASVLGGGPLTDAVYAVTRNTRGPVRVMPATPTWSPAPSITHTGSGPAVTCALADVTKGCFDDHTILLTVKAGGAGGAALASIAYDGTSEIENIVIPAEVPAVLRGTVDITNGADLEGLHLDHSAPASAVLTFPAGSISGAAAGLKAATATVAAPLTWTSSDLIAGGLTAIGAHARRLKFTTAGTAADAPANVVITGSKGGVVKSETLVLAQTAASVESLNDYDTITSLAFPTADGTGATIAVGYLSAYATPAEIITELNTLAVAAPIALLGRAAQDSAGHTFLEVYSTSAGAGVTQTVDPTATGSACFLLGFTVAVNVTATGAAATRTLSWTNIVFTFPAGTYVKGDTYKGPCTGPRASVSAITTAASAARDDYKTNPFGFIAVCQPADTAGNCQTLQSAMATLTAGWIADASNPIMVTSLVGSQFHAASSVLATNDNGIALADAAILAAFDGKSANADTVVYDDVYVPGSPALRSGSYRRSAVWAAAIQRGLGGASGKLAADLADGIIPDMSLLGPDGKTRARDESRAPAKLGRGNGPGFSVLQSVSGSLGVIKFVPGATRAGPTSRLRYLGAYGVGLAAAAAAFQVTELWPGQTPPTDPTTGQLSKDEKERRKNAIDDAIRPILLPDQRPPNVSAFVITISDPPTGKFIDNGKGVVKIALTPLGEFEDVSIQITAVGTTIAA